MYAVWPYRSADESHVQNKEDECGSKCQEVGVHEKPWYHGEATSIIADHENEIKDTSVKGEDFPRAAGFGVVSSCSLTPTELEVRKLELADKKG
ncbi:hypothetical protein NDU88_001285 [Pleurodeles waltl]|uniref:Uncharacterized protein n=1 Tax=Pleurodeles waltl TaxID=8319 RepID=A0AAV7U8W7_PLEWA|nr:hypothetical protein NDU88_001285 [Pleurodeles waltl]